MSSPSALFLLLALVARSLLAVAAPLGLAPLGLALAVLRGALLAVFEFLLLDLLLVGLGVLSLELLERGRLGLGALTRLLLAPLLLGLGLRVGLAGPALRGEGHPEHVEQGERLLVAVGGGGDRHVEAAHLVDRVVVDLGEDDLLADPHRVVAAAVEG